MRFLGRKFNFNIHVVFWVSFLSIMGYGAQRAVLSWHMNALHIDPAMIGLTLSFFGLPRAIMNIVGGYLTDTFGRKLNLIIGVGLYVVVGYLLLAFGESKETIAVSRVFIGMGMAWGTTAAMTILSDYSDPEVLGSVFGIQKGFFWIGITLGGYFAAVFYPSWGFKRVMLFFASLGVLGLFLAGLLESHTPLEKMRVKENMARNWVKVMRECAGDIKYIALGVTGFVAKLLEDGLVITLFPIFFAENVVEVGLSVSVFTVAFAIFQPLGGIYSDRWGRRRIIVGGIFLAFFGVALLLLPGPAKLVLSALFTGCGVGILFPTAEAFAGDLAAAHTKGTAIGYWRFQRDLGSFFGPLLLPYFTLLLGEQVTILILLGLLIFSGILAMTILKGANTAGFSQPG